MNLPFSIDLKNKVAVITGAGGVLCSIFAEAIAACGAISQRYGASVWKIHAFFAFPIGKKAAVFGKQRAQMVGF